MDEPGPGLSAGELETSGEAGINPTGNPTLGEVIAALGQAPGCRIARMSGSGATCFGLFDDCRKAAVAAQALARGNPAWWVKPTLLR